MNAQASQATNGLWTLSYEAKGILKTWKHQFQTENAALLFAAMNTKLLK